jgi:adenylosuccinate lyase
MRQLVLAASSALGAMAEVLSGLEVNAEAMQSNLAKLAPKPSAAQGDGAAQAMIERALAMWREKAP